MTASRDVIRAILAQRPDKVRSLDELADHIFIKLKRYQETFNEMDCLKKIREEMLETHQKAMWHNQFLINAVRNRCNHLHTERESLGIWGRTICIVCGMEVIDVQS